jgi:hypothetical protein
MLRQAAHALLCATAATLALAAPATAATAFVVGPGNKPHVAVDAAGTAHVVWDEQAPFPATDPLHYCRIPRGQRACEGGVRTFTIIDEAFSPAQVLIPGPNQVQLLAFRFGGSGASGTYLLSSTDGGASFSSPTRVGTEDTVNDAVAGPGQSVSVAGGNPGVQFQNSPLAPPIETSEIQFNSSFLYDVTVGLDGATPIVAGWEINNSTGVNNAAFYRYTGAGDINSAGSWAGPTIIAPLQETVLAGGPGGLFLMGQSTTGGVPQSNPYTVRKWNGSTFAPAGTVSPPSDNSIYESDLSQDTAGGLHAVWRLNDSPTHRLRYATSSDGGATWSAPVDIVRSDDIFNTQVSVAPDGQGFAVWDGGGGGANREVRVAPVAAGPVPVIAKTVAAQPVSGKVYVSVPAGSAFASLSVPGIKGRRFVALTAARELPVGSILDTRRGTMRLAAASTRPGQVFSGTFSGGVFQALQSRSGLTTLPLKGSSFRSCTARTGRRASAALSRRVIRRMRANASGRFRTRGRYSAATVRGTIWETIDRCDGTLTKVKRGVVVVRDNRKRRNITLRAGKSYLARAPG